MIEIGFFDELAPFNGSGSIHDSTSGVGNATYASLADYLDGGAFLVTSGQTVPDVIDTSRGSAGVAGLRTDGRFVWPSQLGYYVRNYDVNVGIDIFDYAQAREFRCDEIDDEDLIAIAQRYRQTKLGDSK